ncbi:hypothetical protein PENTCL1PPCAC_10250, partial [Pristionchus entomophagus]
ATYMPLSSSPPFAPSLPPIPPHASASSPTSSCTTTTDADPIYQNIEECRFLYDSPPLPESEYRTIDKPSPTRPTLGSSSSQPMDTPPGYRRIDSATKASPIFSLPPPPPLDDPEQQPSTSGRSEQWKREERSDMGQFETLSKTTSPVSYYDDFSDYGEHQLVATPVRRSDFRPQSQPPDQLRRLGSQKGAGLLSSKPSSPCCSAGCLCCLFLCTTLVFGLAYIIYFFFSDIESWTKANVINKL